ncbi:MAG TPA: DUF2178 domain-containing protein [Candidatus Bathyarchaeia archaeon]
MNTEQYNRVKAAVAAAVGIVAAVSVINDSFTLLLATVTLGMVVLYAAKQRVAEVQVDERTSLIRQRAATTTLGITTVLMAAAGILLVFASRQGLVDLEQLGYALAFQANIILGMNAFLNWHYRNQMGG